MSNFAVNTMEWALNHTGIAAAKRIPGSNLVEIIKESDFFPDFAGITKFAEANGYLLIYGIESKGGKLGGFTN